MSQTKPAFLIAFAVSLLAVPAAAHISSVKSPAPGMHFTEGQPIVLHADLEDDRESRGIIVCPPGETISNKSPPPDYSAPRQAECSGGGTPTGWPERQVLVDGVLQVDSFTGSTTVQNTISFDHNGNDAPIGLFPFSVTGVSAGTHTFVIRGLFSADGVAIDTVDSAPLIVVVDPQPSKTIVSLDDSNSSGTINWNNVLVIGNGKQVNASGGLVIKNSLITGVAGITGSVDSADIEDSLFEDDGLINLTLGSGAVTINRNEFRANNRLSFVPDDPSVPFILSLTGSGTNQKLFQGNRVGAGQLGFAGQNWLIGGDTDKQSNVLIGPRTVINVTGSNTILRGNYDHHVYSPGLWSQGHILDFTSAGAGILVEHNFIWDASWPLQSATGELRYNVVFGYGHTWIRTTAPNTSIHHNLFVPGWHGDGSLGIQCYLGETGLTIYNNTFDAGGKDFGPFPGATVSMDQGSQVASLRNNLITYSSNQQNDNPGDPRVTGGASAYLYADYNAFYSPDNTNKTNYDFTGAGAHDVSGTGDIGVLNGQLAAHPFAGNRLTVDESTHIEGIIESVINEADVWQGLQGVSSVLAILRARYTPKAGSPVIDAGDPQDVDAQGRKADIGAIDANGHDQDKLGKFGMPPSELVPPSVALTTPAAGDVLTGTAALAATAMDEAGGSGVVLVQFLVDGATVAQTATSPYTASFNSAILANGGHSFTARAWDAAGNSATSSAVMAQTMNVVAGGAGGASAGGVSGSAGQSTSGSAGQSTSGGVGQSSGAAGQSSAGLGGASSQSPSESGAKKGGCACRFGAGSQPTLWWVYLALGALGARSRSRRRWRA
ncbi:MAG TPA: Ig-like domain-containing protein [Polyangiaceae bacterium]